MKKGIGIGTALYDKLEKILKRQNILNMNACIACTEIEDEYLTNASIRYHEHLGYRMVGWFTNCGYKFHRWYNLAWMEKGDWRARGRSAAGDCFSGDCERYFFTERRTTFIICMLK